MKTHPVFVDAHHIHHEGHAKVYRVPQRKSRVIAFDVDGTLEVGDPAGSIKLSALKDLKQQGYVVGVISNASTRARVKDKFHDEADFFLTKGTTKAQSMKIVGKDFDQKLYVGNSAQDEKAAKKADWKYVNANQFSARKRFCEVMKE
jgi:ribonucleotide monophosphatase NagD (HAD superfamily)